MASVGSGVGSSVKTSMWPSRDTKPRSATLPMVTAGIGTFFESFGFDNPPTTYGRRTSPNSNATSTSSSGSGMSIQPPFLPIPTCITRHQSET